jgi:hypothetical protein
MWYVGIAGGGLMNDLRKPVCIGALCLSGCASGYEQQPYAGTGDRINPVLCQAPQYLGDYQRGLCASQGAVVAQGAPQAQPTYSGPGTTYSPVYGSGELQASPTRQATRAVLECTGVALEGVSLATTTVPPVASQVYRRPRMSAATIERMGRL